MKVHLKIKRYNPERDEKTWWGEYDVEVDPTDRVLDALHQVKWYHDGSFSLRRSCAHGICGSDAVRINGRNALACKVLIQEVARKDGATIMVEPLIGLPVLKDLIVDMDRFFESIRAVAPYLVNSGTPAGGRERLQSPEERARYDDTTKCILCAACTTSCPIFWADGRYIGPAAIVQAHRFIFDSRDNGTTERLQVLSERNGVWRCRTAFNCTEACPLGIRVTRAIGEVKRALSTGRLE